MKKFNLIIPALPKDLDVFYKNYKLFRKNINFEKIYIITNISNGNLKKIEDVCYVDENKLIDGLTYNAVKVFLEENSKDSKMTGWYFQQFLKMAYSLVEMNEYYLLWDADTVPVRKIKLFDKDNPILHLKNEYHKEYFETIDNLFNGKYKKIKKKSFICEHMLINTSIMKQLISKIERKNHIPFWKVILNSVDENSINNAGFSEFETYGTFTHYEFPKLYKYKTFKSCRYAKSLFGDNLTESQIKWARRSYSALSFEKYDKLSNKNKLWNNKIVRLIIWPSLVYNVLLFVAKIKKIIKKS